MQGAGSALTGGAFTGSGLSSKRTLISSGGNAIGASASDLSSGMRPFSSSKGGSGVPIQIVGTGMH